MGASLMALDYRAIYKHTSHHREEIERSEFCGCFHCLQAFKPSQLEEDHWTDDGTTALCPLCGMDAVIGSAAGWDITVEFLEEMQEYAFRSH
jgi:hypothetical protein